MKVQANFWIKREIIEKSPSFLFWLKIRYSSFWNVHTGISGPVTCFWNKQNPENAKKLLKLNLLVDDNIIRKFELQSFFFYSYESQWISFSAYFLFIDSQLVMLFVAQRSTNILAFALLGNWAWSELNPDNDSYTTGEYIHDFLREGLP